MRGSSISTLKLCFGFPGLSSGFGRRQWGPKSLSVEKELWEISYDILAGKKSVLRLFRYPNYPALFRIQIQVINLKEDLQECHRTRNVANHFVHLTEVHCLLFEGNITFCPGTNNI